MLSCVPGMSCAYSSTMMMRRRCSVTQGPVYVVLEIQPIAACMLGNHLRIRAAQPAHEALIFRRGQVLLLRNKVNLINVPTDCFRTVCKRQSAKQVCGALLHPGPPKHWARNRHMHGWERSQGAESRTHSAVS